MKKLLLTGILSVALFSSAALAVPSDFKIMNNTGYSTNAYVHGVASPSVVGAYSFANIPWANVTDMCHGVTPPLKAQDPCSFEVYATNGADPQQIDVGTVVFYLSDGNFEYVSNHALSYGLKIVPLAAGQIELEDTSCHHA